MKTNKIVHNKCKIIKYSIVFILNNSLKLTN
uniref:Uncharacterized protein n=1 Tax=Anguilla anguilla TaxID=7936 RepID=A0A0E9PYL5_ANGAN